MNPAGRHSGARVSLYLQRGCRFCAAAERLLRARGVAFDAFDVTDDPSARDELVRRTGAATLPQLFVDGAPIGGFAELQRLDRDGGLRRVRQAAS
jgi:glutaredoxin 3